MSDQLLQAVTGRRRKEPKKTPFAYGILTADLYVQTLQDRIGLDACYRYAAKGNTSFDDLMRKAAKTLVYSNQDMDLETTASSARFKELMAKAPEGVELPKNALMVFRHKLTTSRKDRDGDTLHSDGAMVDKKMLLLWQHVHTLPLGPYLFTASQDDQALRVVSAIIDMNELCHDAAVMVDNKMGRFSHGFRALEFTETKGEGAEDGGFDVKRFEVMEESLVSVPANVDAETEEVMLSLIESGKLTSPLMKCVGRSLRDERRIQVPGVRYKLRQNGRIQELVCNSIADLKAASDAGLIGGNNDENKSGGGSQASGGGRQGTNQAPVGSPEETHEGAAGPTKADGAGRQKMMPIGQGTPSLGSLTGSWEAVASSLANAASRYLVAMGVPLRENNYVWAMGTFPDHVIVEVSSGASDRECYRIGWEMKDGKPTLTGQPEQVDIRSTVTVEEQSLEARRAEQMLLKQIRDGQKPYPNEHSCRIRQPGDFKADSFKRMSRKHDGKEYDVIMGRLEGEDTMTEQSYRYPKGAWDADDARSHCEGHDGNFEAASREEASAAYNTKQGRSLSKANEAKIRDAKEDVDEAVKIDGVARPCKALLKTASGSLGEVLSSLGEEQEPKATKDPVTYFLLNATGDQQKRMIEELKSLEAAKARQKLADDYRELIGEKPRRRESS